MSVYSGGLARVLNETLCVEFGIRGKSLLAAMRDGASVNEAALNRMAFIFQEMLNVVYFSYTIDNVANHLDIATILETCRSGSSVTATKQRWRGRP